MMSKLSNKKTVFYALILLAALTGLVIDRTHSASAAPTASLFQRAAIKLPTKSDPEKIQPVGPAIAAVFRIGVSSGNASEASSVHEVRDAFSLSAGMREYYESIGRQTSQDKDAKIADQSQIDQQKREAFQETHKLKGTFIRPPDIWAVIDDQIMRIGDLLEGFTLDQIDHYRVRFRQGQNEVRLELLDAPESQEPVGDRR